MVRVWNVGASMPPSSHTYTIGGNLLPAQSLTKKTKCKAVGRISIDSQTARKWGLIYEGLKLLHVFNSVYLIY